HAALIGCPENPPVVRIEYVFDVGGQPRVIPGEPMAVSSDPGGRRRLDVIPPISLRFVSNVELFPPGGAHPVDVELTAARPRAAGTVQLTAPAGWTITPPSQPFQLAASGDRARFTFTVGAPRQPATGRLEASVTINGTRFNNQRVELRYDHIPFQLLQPAAVLKTASLDLAIRGRRVGYLPGAGDDVAAGLQRMGYGVTELASGDLTAEKLAAHDVVVIGIRAFNTRKDLGAHMPALFAYVEAGGTMIVQYNNLEGLHAGWLT